MPCASTRCPVSPSRVFKAVDRGNFLFRVGAVEPSSNEAPISAPLLITVKSTNIYSSSLTLPLSSL